MSNPSPQQDSDETTERTTTGSRRSFLKRCAAAGAVALGLGAASEPASADHHSIVQLGIDASFDRMNTWSGDVDASHIPENPFEPRWEISSYVRDAGQPPIGRGVDKLAYTRAQSFGAGHVSSSTWTGHRIRTTGGAAHTANIAIGAFYYQGSSQIQMFESEHGGWGRNLLDLSVMDGTAGAEVARSRAWEHMDTSVAMNNPYQPAADPQTGAPGRYITTETGAVTLHPDRMYAIYFALTSEAVSTGRMSGGETRPPNTFASQFAFIGQIEVDFI